MIKTKKPLRSIRINDCRVITNLKRTCNKKDLNYTADIVFKGVFMNLKNIKIKSLIKIFVFIKLNSIQYIRELEEYDTEAKKMRREDRLNSVKTVSNIIDKEYEHLI